MARVRYLKVEDGRLVNIQQYPSFSATGSVKGMKDLYYRKDALLVKCGSYIYNVTNAPHIYYSLAH